MINVRIEVHITGPSKGEFVTMTFPVEGEQFADWAGRVGQRGDLMVACHHAGLVARDELWQAAVKAHDERDAARGALPDATGEASAEEYVRTMRDEEWRDA